MDQVDEVKALDLAEHLGGKSLRRNDFLEQSLAECVCEREENLVSILDK